MNVLRGEGVISASGGDGHIDVGNHDRSGCGGGGGRIRIDYNSKTFDGTLLTAPGEGFNRYPVQWGSVFLKSRQGDLWVEGGRIEIDENDAFNSIELGSNGELSIDGPAMITQQVTLSEDAVLRVTDSTAFNNLRLNPVIEGTLVVDEDVSWPITEHNLSGTKHNSNV